MNNEFRLVRIDIEALLQRILGCLVQISTFENPANLLQGRDFERYRFSVDGWQGVNELKPFGDRLAALAGVLQHASKIYVRRIEVWLYADTFPVCNDSAGTIADNPERNSIIEIYGMKQIIVGIMRDPSLVKVG